MLARLFKFIFYHVTGFILSNLQMRNVKSNLLVAWASLGCYGCYGVRWLLCCSGLLLWCSGWFPGVGLALLRCSEQSLQGLVCVWVLL